MTKMRSGRAPTFQSENNFIFWISQLFQSFWHFFLWKWLAMPAIFIFKKTDPISFDSLGNNYCWLVSGIKSVFVCFFNFQKIMSINCEDIPSKTTKSID